jgi:V/A-type H+-transporting ATPase subunit C
VPVPALKATRDSIRYGFAVGKVRVLETRIFGQSTYERLLDAADVAEQFRILSDTVYGRYLDHAASTSDVERGLDRALDDFYLFLDEAHLPAEVVRFFRERYDFANLKGALKAHALATGSEGLLADLGTIPVEDFRGHLDELPEPFGSLAEHLMERMRVGGSAPAQGDSGSSAATGEGSSGSRVSEIDAEVDRAMFAELGRLARESGSSFLEELVELQVDIANVKSLLRARIAGKDAEHALGLLIKGGSVRPKEFEYAYRLSPPEAAQYLSALRAFRGIPASELVDIARLDVLADNVVVAHLRRARAVSLGAEPVIAYVMGREAEVRAVRMLLVGRLAGLPRELLRARLRDLYV